MMNHDVPFTFFSSLQPFQAKKKKKEKPTLNKHLFLPNSFVSFSFSLVFF